MLATPRELRASLWLPPLSHRGYSRVAGAIGALTGDADAVKATAAVCVYRGGRVERFSERWL